MDSYVIDFSVIWKNDAKYSDSRPLYLTGEFKSNGRRLRLNPNDDWKKRAYFSKKDEDNQELLYHSFTIADGGHALE